MTVEQILDSKLVLLIAGFILTTISGGILTYFFQKRSWKRQAQLDLYKKKYDEGTKFLDDLAEMIGRRFYFLQKFLWAILSKDKERIVRVEKEYFEIVNIWNFNYYKNRTKIKLLVGEKFAEKFLDYKDDKKAGTPMSLHYKIVLAHRKVMEAKDDNAKTDVANEIVNELNSSCSVFIEQLTKEFTIKAENLELLNFKKFRQNSNRK